MSKLFCDGLCCHLSVDPTIGSRVVDPPENSDREAHEGHESKDPERSGVRCQQTIDRVAEKVGRHDRHDVLPRE